MIFVDETVAKFDGDKATILAEITIALRHVVKEYGMSEEEMQMITNLAKLSDTEIRDRALRESKQFFESNIDVVEETLVKDFMEFMEHEDCENCNAVNKCSALEHKRKYENNEISTHEFAEYIESRIIDAIKGNIDKPQKNNADGVQNIFDNLFKRTDKDSE